MVERIQHKMAIRFARGYRTVALGAIRLIARTIPLDLTDGETKKIPSIKVIKRDERDRERAIQTFLKRWEGDADRFRIFHTTINLQVYNIDKVVLACCAVHNFLRRNCSHTYTSKAVFDVEDTTTGTITSSLRTHSDNLLDPQKGYNRNHTAAADLSESRTFFNYFLDHNAKSQAYILIEKLQTVHPEANRDSVVKKINSLRTTYRKELKRVLDSERSGAGDEDIYVPHLWYYAL
ncbi:hypothetical protein NQ314_018565 [Rhamnusium bicolor]|uniref:DDE Tnp4 domain-containing protein n=1 Tax=Rhamnusium bicolor TaxID=1586634 RepID=A0AAV8WRS2_9CUCU|nr:hypothetical protein NQ314_018565 [Rhamnusium bicolor]